MKMKKDMSRPHQALAKKRALNLLVQALIIESQMLESEMENARSRMEDIGSTIAHLTAKYQLKSES